MPLGAEVQWLKSIFGRSRERREPSVIRVEPSAEGFVVWKEDAGVRSVRWPEVESIYAYKVDCFTVDMIWLAFVLEGREEIHIREEAEGFEHLMSDVSGAFRGIDGEW